MVGKSIPMDFKKIGAIAPFYTGGSFRREGLLYTACGDTVFGDGVPVHTFHGLLAFDVLRGEVVAACGNTVSRAGHRAVFGSPVSFLRAVGDFAIVGTREEVAVVDAELQTVFRGPMRATAAAATPQGIVIGTEWGELHFLGREKKTHGAARVNGAVFHGGLLYTASVDGRIVIWDKEPVALDAGETVLGMDTLLDKVAVLTERGVMTVENGRFVDFDLGLGDGPFSLRLSFKAIRDGLVATTENEIYDASCGAFLIGNNDEVTDLRLLEGGRLAVCTNSGRLRVYSGGVVLTQPHTAPILSFSPETGVSCSWEDVVFYNGASPRCKVALAGGSGVCGDGDFVCVSVSGEVHCIGPCGAAGSGGCSHGCVVADGAASFHKCRAWKAHEKEITAIAYCRGRIVTCSMDRSVKLWTKEGELLGAGEHKKGVNCVIMGKKEVISADKCIKTWSVPEMEQRSAIELSVPVLSLWKGKGLLFCGDALGVIRVYRDGKAVFCAEGHKDRVWAITRCSIDRGGAEGLLGHGRGVESWPAGEGDVWVTGGADGLINFYVDNTEEHRRLLEEKEREERALSSTISLLSSNEDLRALVTVLLEKGDRRVDDHIVALFYGQEGDRAFLKSLEWEKVSKPVSRLGSRVKNLEVCQFLIGCSGSEEMKKLRARHKRVIDALYLELLSFRLYFKSFY